MAEYEAKFEIIKYKKQKLISRNRCKPNFGYCSLWKQNITENTSQLFNAKMFEYEIKSEIIKNDAWIRNGLAKARIAVASKTLATEQLETAKESTKT